MKSGRRVAARPGRGRPGRAVRPSDPPAGPHLGPLERRAGRGRPGRRRARTAGPPSARRARASTRPTPGSSWLPGIRGGKGVEPVGGRAPPALRDLDRPLLRAGAPKRSSWADAADRADLGAGPAPARTGDRSLVLAATPRTTRVVGEPLCPECFDYPGAVLWNAHVSALWARTCHRLYREVARSAGVSTPSAALIRPALLHQGGRVPSPRARPPPRRGPCRRRRRAERAAATVARRGDAERRRRSRRRRGRSARARRRGNATCAGPAGAPNSTSGCSWPATTPTPRPSPPTWPSTPPRRPTARRGWPIGSARAQIERLGLRPHIVALVRTAWTLGRRRELAPLRLRDHAHTLGYPGQFSSKSVALLDHLRGAAPGPGRLRPRGDRRRATSTTTASGVTPAGATGDPDWPICWPERCSRRAWRAPARFPRVPGRLPERIPELHDQGRTPQKLFWPGTDSGTIRGSIPGTRCGAMAP